MNVAWLFCLEFGAFLLLLAGLLGHRIQPGGRVAAWRNVLSGISVEGIVLQAATTAAAGRYAWLLLDGAASPGLPAIGVAWVIAFAAACVIYLGTKTGRAMQVRVEEEGL